MERVPEPELMEEIEQARAYSQADFDAPHDHFVDLAGQVYPLNWRGSILDLGCGPADITVRFARRYPDVDLVGVDGSRAMLEFGEQRVKENGLADRIELRELFLPTDALRSGFDGVISNSLLHHLHDPLVIWRSISQHVKVGGPVFVMDLMRPQSVDEAQKIVDDYSSGEPEVLRKDFFFSLRAAYRPDEVSAQLEQVGLSHLNVEAVSDRHLIVHGCR